tara:strand:- start:62 stop:1138 length:1077 start_codon:yes stop_codon:yes gene_type:complete
MIFDPPKINKIIKRRKNKCERWYKSVPLGNKKKKKISNDLFVIPELKDYSNLTKINYNKAQLKQILKRYGQPVSGNKEVIIHRCYNFLRLSYFAVIIQKNFKRHLVSEYIRVSGPAINNYDLCTNKTDFLSLENLSKIKSDNFFSFQDEDKFIYGFEFCSIYNLLLKENPAKNPYNRKEFPKNILENIDKKIKLSKILGFPIKIELDDLKNDSKSNFKFRVLAVFHKMDELGNYTNTEWFFCLKKFHLIKFLRELLDIWEYRAQLTWDTKRRIFPPNGNPFERIRLDYLVNKSEDKIKKMVLFIIENLITKGIDKNAKCLGAFYVLGALTLVNSDAASALPWLYESVRHNPGHGVIQV